MHKAIVYGGAEYVGIEMSNLITEQGLSQLHSLLLGLCCTGTANKLAIMTISKALYLASTSCSSLNDVSTSLPHLTMMVQSQAVHHFLCNLSPSIDLSPTFVSPLQCEDDLFLMDIALTLNCPPSALLTISACQLYLDATFVSDVTDPSGTHLQ